MPSPLASPTHGAYPPRGLGLSQPARGSPSMLATTRPELISGLPSPSRSASGTLEVASTPRRRLRTWPSAERMVSSVGRFHGPATMMRGLPSGPLTTVGLLAQLPAIFGGLVDGGGASSTGNPRTGVPSACNA